MKPSRQHWFLGSIFAATFVGAMAIPSTATANSDSYDPPPPGTITFQNSTHLRDANTLTVHGSQENGGCSYGMSVSLPRGQDEIQFDEASENPQTCTATFKRGFPTTRDTPSPGAGYSELSGSSTAQPAQSKSVTPQTSVHSKGRTHAWFQDPIPKKPIHVNTVTQRINWHWNGKKISHVHCSHTYKWFTGWGLKGHNARCRYKSHHHHANSSSNAHFKNGVFCAFTDTHVYYNRVHVLGGQHGGLSGNWHWKKTGACSGMFSFHTNVKRTLH